MNKTQTAKKHGITRQVLDYRLKNWIELKLECGRVVLVSPVHMMDKPE